MQPDFRQLAAASTVTDSSARPGPEGLRPGPGHLPGSGLVICAITGRESSAEAGAGPFDGLWQRTFLGQDGVDMAAARFGRGLLPHGADTPDWAIVVAPGVIRMTGRDLEQSWWADRRSIEPRCSRRKPSQRAEVTCWTRKSRAKMALTLASLDWSYLEDATGLPAMVTLTYPGDWLPVAGSGQAVKKHMFTLLKRWQRAWGEPLTGAWKLEFQARGAPHVHIGPVVIPLGRAGQASRLAYDADMAAWQAAGGAGRRPYYRAGPGDGLSFHKWLSLTWADIVNHPDPAERARHELAGTGVDYREGLRCSDPKRLSIYFAKHGAYRAKDYQNVVPEQWRQPGCHPGRFWGYWGLRPCRATVELRKHEHLAVSRALRHLSERGRRWNPETRRTETRKAMRELVVVRPSLRPDRVTGELVPVRSRKRKLRRPVRRLKNHRGFVCVNDGPGLAVTLARLIGSERQADMIMIKELAKCVVRGCPVRYPTGEDRLCPTHEDESAGDALGRLAELTREAPVGHAVAECQVALPLLSGAVESASDSGKC